MGHARQRYRLLLLYYQKGVYRLYSKIRNTLSRAGVIALIAGCLAISMQAAAAPAAETDQPSPETFDIVVLGDSLAAGYEHGFTEKSVPYGYAEHVFEQALFQGYRAEYVNYGILGLRSDGLSKWLSAATEGTVVSKEDIQATLSDPRAEAFFANTEQLNEDVRSAELILISIGGNDFLQLLYNLEEDGEIVAFDKLSTEEQTELQTKLADLLDTYEDDLESTLETIRQLQLGAEIVVANQYLPVPFMKIKGEVSYLIPESTADFLVEGQTKLHERLKAIVADFEGKDVNIKIADAAAAIEKSILTYTSISDGDVHPTKSGYAALGKAFSETIWGEYKTVQNRPANVPISVVVNGEELISKYVPVLKQNRTFVAIADITDAIGAERKWNAATNTATILLDGFTVEITIGAKTIKINGKTMPLNAEPAYFQQYPGESKTYVPLAALSEGLGLQVKYRDTLKTAFINP